MKRLVVLAVLSLILSSAPNVSASGTPIIIKGDGPGVTQQSTGSNLATVAMQLLNVLLAI
jgi:hypothetical protein